MANFHYSDYEVPLVYTSSQLPLWDPSSLAYPMGSNDHLGHQARETAPRTIPAAPLYHQSTAYTTSPPQLANDQYLTPMSYPLENQFYFDPTSCLEVPYPPTMQQPYNEANHNYPVTSSTVGFDNDLHVQADQYDLPAHSLAAARSQFLEQGNDLNYDWTANDPAFYGLSLPMNPPNSYESAGSHSTGSPIETSFEVASVSSNGSWQVMRYSPARVYPEAVNGSSAVCDPHEVLHLRSGSGSSDEDFMRVSVGDSSDFSAIASSPESEHPLELVTSEPSPPSARARPHGSSVSSSHYRPITIPSGSQRVLSIKPASGSPPSKVSKSSSGRRRGEAARLSAEKRVGRRGGPLNIEQRKQANEIRKIGACIRCKFLKKSCTQGEVCAGCQPSHARLWNVPCSRVQIQDLCTIFLKDWTIDTKAHEKPATRSTNVINFGMQESMLILTHNFGPTIQLKVREVDLHDKEGFDCKWIETIHKTPREFEIRTAPLAIGCEGIAESDVNAYLDQHLDRDIFPEFIENHFEGTEFLSKLLQVAHNYYLDTQHPMMSRVLKLVVAYNLTQHVTFVDNIKDCYHGRHDGFAEHPSKYAGRFLAPNMVNYAIKVKLADVWRKLMDDVLRDLSILLSGVYHKDKLKNWALIFLLSSLILSVWELMVFDTYKRSSEDSPDGPLFEEKIEKVPVATLVGLMGAVSQKLPAWGDWKTEQCSQVLGGNVHACKVLEEMTGEVNTHLESGYLQTRPSQCYDPIDFDCFSNKFTSQLVIKA